MQHAVDCRVTLAVVKGSTKRVFLDEKRLVSVASLSFIGKSSTGSQVRGPC